MRKWLWAGYMIFSLICGGQNVFSEDNPCKQPDKPKGDCPLVATEDCEWECTSDDDHFCCFFTIYGVEVCDEMEKGKEECCEDCKKDGGKNCMPGSGGDGGTGGGWGGGPAPVGTKSLGETNAWGGSVVFKFNLGDMIGSKRPAGHLYVRAPGPIDEVATPSCLSLVGDALAGVQAVVLNKKIQRVYAPQVGVLVVVNNPHEYELRFYEAGILESYGDGIPTENPFTVWRVFDPDAGTNEYKRLTFLQLTGGQTNNLVEYEWMSANSVVWRTGEGLRKDQISWSILAASGSTNRIDVHMVLNPDDSVAERTVRTYRHYIFGDELISEQKGAEGEEITIKEVSYYTDPSHPGRYGKVSREIDSDGAWVRYDYDLEGRKVSEISTWLDGTTNAPDDESVVAMLDYTCVDSRETPRYNDRRWRTRIKWIAGQWVSTSYRAYFYDGDERVLIEEEAATESSVYGDEANRRTIRRENGAGADMRLRGKPLSITHPDGTEDKWTYHMGTYSVSSPDVGVFTEQTGGSFVEVTKILQSNLQSPYQSTRTVSVWDAYGREIQTETQVCTGSNQYERMDWQTVSRDEYGRELVRRFANGLTTETTWDCCGKQAETGPDGQRETFVHDMLGRTILTIKEDGPTNIVVYDALGKIVSKATSAGGLSLSTSNRYDLAGRLVESWDEARLSTTIVYGERTKTVSFPGGATKTTARLRDGKVKSVTGTVAIPKYSEYGIESNGEQWVKSYMGTTNSPAWNMTRLDLRGRTSQTERPGFGGAVITNAYEYDDEGRLTRVSMTGEPDQITQYDDRGEQIRSGADVDVDDVLTLASMDRIQDQQNEYVLSGSNWLHQQVSILYPFDNSATRFTNSINRTQVGGSGCSCKAGLTETVDARGNVTTSQTSVDPVLKQVTKMLTRSGIANTETTVTVNGLLQSRTLPTGAEYRYLYDGLRRRTGSVDPRIGTNVTTFLSNGRVDYIEDAATNRTTFGYDSVTGRRVSVTDAMSNTVYSAYDLRGNVTNTWGATYPVAYEYDANGRMTAIKTWRDTNGAPDVTRWNFDEATGLLTNKVYADGNGPSYEYDAVGHLTKRIWARETETVYNYDDLGQLTGITYSDDTPDVTCAYNRLGQAIVVTDGTGARGFNYDPFMNLRAETNWLATIGRTYDEQGRPATVAVGSEYEVGYDYDDYGRLASITSTVHGIYTYHTQHHYSYLANSTMLSAISNGSLATIYEYESNRNHKTNVEHQWGANPVSSYAYTYDAVGRMVGWIGDDSTTNEYGYNLRSELVDAVMGTNIYRYIYDAIGNRIIVTNNGAATTYVANELNQYTNVVPVPGAMMYDLDGNLRFDGTWNYSWDGENRLIGMRPVATNAGSVRLNYAYDFMSRRSQKEVEVWDGSIWSNSLIVRYGYDHLTLICEDRSDESTPIYYVWGMDSFGSMHSMGVGGLLARIRKETIPQPLYYASDADGNITDVLDKNGDVVAYYTYDGFGNTIAQSGSHADINPFRFNTKHYDAETGYYCSSPRYYSSQLGRWIGASFNQGDDGSAHFSFAADKIHLDASSEWQFLLSQQYGAREGTGSMITCDLGADPGTPMHIDNANEGNCLEDCTKQHEEQHRADQEECCFQAQKAYKDAGNKWQTGETPAQFAISVKWRLWVKDNPDHECAAYTKSLECALGVSAENDCFCGSSDAKKQECCNLIEKYLNGDPGDPWDKGVVKEKEKNCGKADGSKQKCPGFP